MATAIEYGLIAALVAVAAIGVASSIDTKVKKSFNDASASMSESSNSVAWSRGWVRNNEYVERGGHCFVVSFGTDTPTVTPLNCTDATAALAAH